MSPRSKEQYEVIRRQSMDAIEAAALDLFGHQGYANTSIAQIAKKAGVSKGLLYNYYESKADLLKSIMMHAMEIGKDIINTDFFRSHTPVEILHATVDMAVQSIRQNPTYWKLLTSLSLQMDVIEELKPLIDGKIDSSMSLYVPIFEQLGYPDPKAQAFLFGATMDGVLLQFVSITNMDYPIDDIIHNFKTNYCKPYQP